MFPLVIQNQAAAKYAPSVIDAFNCAYNPALSPLMPEFAAGLYTENRFLTEELKLVSAAAVIRRSQSGISLLIRHFGNIDYNENCFGLNYGFSLGKVSLGAIFNYQMLQVGDGSSENYIKYGVASVWQLSEKVFTSFRLTNPHFFERGSQQRYPVATLTQFGIGYAASRELYIGVESQKEEDKPPQLVFAICYQYAGKYFFGCNWTTGSQQPYLSAGWQWKNLRIETGCAFHQVLGISPSLTILYQKTKTE
jgi:hypothetical protein